MASKGMFHGIFGTESMRYGAHMIWDYGQQTALASPCSNELMTSEFLYTTADQNVVFALSENWTKEIWVN
jgi:hypothetical protein